MHFVGNASISWNACVPTAASTTGAASAAMSVRPHSGQVATDNTQKMVSGPRRPREGLWAWPCLEARSWKVEGNWSAGHEVETGSRWHLVPLSSYLCLLQRPECGVLRNQEANGSSPANPESCHPTSLINGASGHVLPPSDASPPLPSPGHFYCLQHLPQPRHKEEGNDRGPGSQVKAASACWGREHNSVAFSPEDFAGGN